MCQVQTSRCQECHNIYDIRLALSKNRGLSSTGSQSRYTNAKDYPTLCQRNFLYLNDMPQKGSAQHESIAGKASCFSLEISALLANEEGNVRAGLD